MQLSTAHERLQSDEQQNNVIPSAVVFSVGSVSQKFLLCQVEKF